MCVNVEPVLLCWYLIHIESIRNGIFLSLRCLSNLGYPSLNYPLLAERSDKHESLISFHAIFLFFVPSLHFLFSSRRRLFKVPPMRKAASAAGLADGKCGTVPKDSLARAQIIPLARSQSATVTWTKTREADLSRAQQPFLSFKV